MKSYVNMSDYAVKHREERALDDLVWRVMENEEGRPFDLVDFLAEQKDFHELVCAAIRLQDPWGVVNMIEQRLRSRLEDSDEVAERAAEMARED